MSDLTFDCNVRRGIHKQTFDDRETHQAAPGISKQLGLFVAEGCGEDGEIGAGQLLKVGPAAGLAHQRVTAERQSDKNGTQPSRFGFTNPINSKIHK